MYINSDIYYLLIRKIVNDLDDYYLIYILDGYYFKSCDVIKYLILLNKWVLDWFKLGEKLGKFYFEKNIEYFNVYIFDG